MADYRLYFLDPSGQRREMVELDCRDDAHAIELVEQQRDGRAMELWRRTRVVKRFEAGARH